MNHPTDNSTTKKTMNYGQCQAVKVLAAHRIGLNPSCVDDAIALMMGRPVHPVIAASVEREAARIHNELAQDGSTVSTATTHVHALMAEYGFA